MSTNLLLPPTTEPKFEKQPQQTVTYRNYKDYNEELFANDKILEILEFHIQSIPYEIFTNIFIDILNLYATMKKYLRANHSKFISKELKLMNHHISNWE